MKVSVLVLIVLFTLSCKDHDINPNLNIYNEWKWVMTTFDTRGRPVTAEALDSTYYYTFTRKGQLEIRDDGSVLTRQFNFEIIADPSFNRIEIEEVDLVWGYTIRNDTLRIWKPFSIFPETTIFKIN